jgi:hypothetical protein
MWYRIFGTSDVEPEPAVLLQYLRERGIEEGKFRGDEEGWFAAEFRIRGGGSIELNRFLSTEEGIRNELNTWAAWLETAEDNPNHVRLMQHMIGTRQLFTLEVMADDEVPVEDLCRFLAQATEGVYQVDGQGFFAADGTLLVQEGP